MKSNLKSLAVAGLFIGITLRSHAQGTIVLNGVTSSGFNGLGYGINVIHNPSNGDTTGFFLDPDGKTPPSNPSTNTFIYSPIVDVGVRVFLVSANDPISLQPILSMNYTELGSQPNYVFQSGTPFYVGLYTGNQQFAPPNGIYSDPLFGWAELENNNGVISLLGGVLEYQGGGIYAGTDTIIPAPEPSTVGLFCAGGLLFSIYRWRRK